MLDQILTEAFLEAVIRAMIPILLAAMGGLIAERSGVFQISLEGSILAGAFGAVAASYATGSSLVGVLAGGLAGILISLILAFGAVSRKADPIVLGIAINLFALGFTGFLLTQIFDIRGSFSDPAIVGLPDWRIPGLSSIPGVGSAFFELTALGYIAFLSVPVLWFVLFRTTVGLRLRGVGEHPTAARTLGVSVVRYRYGAVGFSGLMAGLGGAQLSLSNVVLFTDGMSAGRGWIAIVGVMLGRAHPVAVLGVVGLFGFSEAYGFRLQGNGLPSQITDALPFAVTIVALAVSRKRFAKLLNLAATPPEVGE